MKSPALILITGLPGAGKTTVAKMLAERLGCVSLNSDEIRRELFPTVRSYTSQETRAVIAETERRTERLLREGSSVILDALFTKQPPRDWYKELAQKTGARFSIILVIAAEERIKERLDARSAANNPSEATFGYYLDRKKHFEPVRGEHVVIENSGDTQTLSEKIEILR